jgi:hypothetical protein
MCPNVIHRSLSRGTTVATAVATEEKIERWPVKEQRLVCIDEELVESEALGCASVDTAGRPLR